MANSTKRIAFGSDQPSALRLPWLRFFRDFSSVVRQMLGYTMQSGGAAASPKRLTNVAYLQFATEPVWAQNPNSQPTEVYPSHN